MASIRITSKRDGFRRGGITHSSKPVEHVLEALNNAQLLAILAEPMLDLVGIDFDGKETPLTTELRADFIEHTRRLDAAILDLSKSNGGAEHPNTSANSGTDAGAVMGEQASLPSTAPAEASAQSTDQHDPASDDLSKSNGDADHGDEHPNTSAKGGTDAGAVMGEQASLPSTAPAEASAQSADQHDPASDVAQPDAPAISPAPKAHVAHAARADKKKGR
jgi:hypothetical protein